MGLERRDDVRNLAVIAHVDHGKTTVVDAMLWQSELFREHGRDAEAVLEAFDPKREKSIAVMSRYTSLSYRGVRLNLLDLPGHANFGSQVERTLGMVEGVLLLVDASEGPLPQNRFVLRKALEAGLAPVVVLNKIDLRDARPVDVLKEVRELFVDLDAEERQREFPVVYCNALRGSCRRSLGDPERPLSLLLDTVLETVPAPAYEPDAPLRMRVTDLGYDDFLGRLAIGRIHHGDLRVGQEVKHRRQDDTEAVATVGGLFGFNGVRRVEIASAGPGDIVAVTGLEAVGVGDTLGGEDDPEPLQPERLEEPTIAIDILVNDSPTAGQDGQHASGAELKERLWQEILTNVSIRVEDTDSPDKFRICGRGELQLAILVEMLRREGYEMLVGTPTVLTRDVDGVLQEPWEILVIDCPEEFSGVVTQKIESRRGRLIRMVNHGRGRVRVEFRVPSAGLLGFRTEFLSDTRRTGIMNHALDDYEPADQVLPSRSTGALVADRPGRATAHAIEHLQSRGTMFVAPGTEVYEGMIVGENSKANDVEVNVTKDKRPGVGDIAGSAQVVRLIPPRSMSLEQAIEFIREDEVVEVTPRALRLRKKILVGRKS